MRKHYRKISKRVMHIKIKNRNFTIIHSENYLFGPQFEAYEGIHKTQPFAFNVSEGKNLKECISNTKKWIAYIEGSK